MGHEIVIVDDDGREYNVTRGEYLDERPKPSPPGSAYTPKQKRRLKAETYTRGETAEDGWKILTISICIVGLIFDALLILYMTGNWIP